LVRRINPDDSATLKLYWEKKSFACITFMLRKYGIDFKGVTYLEVLVDELIKIGNMNINTTGPKQHKEAQG